MTTLAELELQVYQITNRADLVAETKLAIRQATIAFHHANYFWRDCVFQLIDMSSTQGYKWNINISSTFPNLRVIDSIRLWCPVSETIGHEISYTQQLGCRGKEFWRVEGNNLHLESPYTTKQFQIKYYKNPDLANYSSWVADMYPYMIVEYAAAKVLSMIGHSQLAQELLRAVGKPQGSGMPSTGYFGTLTADNLERRVRGY